MVAAITKRALNQQLFGCRGFSMSICSRREILCPSTAEDSVEQLAAIILFLAHPCRVIPTLDECKLDSV